MKFGSIGLEVEKEMVLRKLFYRLEDYIIEEKQTDYAFRISIFKSRDPYSSDRTIKYIVNEIPITNVTYALPQVRQIPFHNNKFKIKERIKILFRGKLWNI